MAMHRETLFHGCHENKHRQSQVTFKFIRQIDSGGSKNIQKHRFGGILKLELFSLLK